MKTAIINTPPCTSPLTRYYLLLKKFITGKLESEELEIIQERNQLHLKSPHKSSDISKNPSFMNNQAGSLNTSQHYRGHLSSRDGDSKADRGLPLLHPQLNIGDITYSFKEKITINTAPNKHAGGNTQNFNIYMRGPSKDDQPPQVFAKTAPREGSHEYRRPSERGEPLDAQLNPHLQSAATKSFDFSRPGKPRVQMTSTDFYSRDARKSTSQDTGEPKSRKLLEMMLKRISRLNVEDEGTLPHARSFSRNAQHSRTWDNKSVSMDHNKKKLNLTMSRNYETQNYQRKSSRDSQRAFPSGTGSSGGFQQKPLGSTAKSKPIQIRNLRMKNTGN